MMRCARTHERPQDGMRRRIHEPFQSIVALDISEGFVRKAMANHLKTEIVVDALDMALAQRRAESVIQHSGRGCQYMELLVTGQLREEGAV